MKSFKEQERKIAEAASAQTSGDAQAGNSAETLTRKIAQAYNGKSNMAMLQNILQEAERSKRAGTLSNEEIEAFYQSFSPMLSPAQRKQLRIVVDRLKGI